MGGRGAPWWAAGHRVPLGIMSAPSTTPRPVAANSSADSGSPRDLERSVWPRLEPLLPQVTKPIQYVGGELGAVVKDWDAVTVRWALMYPDAYEVGLPNQGVQILYEVLNELPDVLAERTYAVWPDLEKLMRAHGVPQFTVDAHRSVRDFDMFGVSFSTELGYTNLLTAIDLAASRCSPPTAPTPTR